MSARSTIAVHIDPVNHVAEISGFHAKRLIYIAGGRLFWSRRSRSWVTTETVASDVIAMAERDGCDVILEQAS